MCGILNLHWWEFRVIDQLINDNKLVKMSEKLSY